MITTQANIASKGSAPIRLRIRDITSTHEAELELDPSLRVGAVAQTAASRMSLPADTSWALRQDSTAAFLDDDAAIGDVLGTDGDTEVFLTATPRAHLGGGRGGGGAG